MQKKGITFLFTLFIFLFVNCKQNEGAKLNFETDDLSFELRDFSIKAVGEEAYTNIPLEKLKDGSYIFTSIDPEVEMRVVSSLNLKTVKMENGDIKIDDKSQRLAYGKIHGIGATSQSFKVEIVANNDMKQTLNFSVKYVKNHIRGLKVKLDEKIYSINDLSGATLELSGGNANIEVISMDVMTKVELKDQECTTPSILAFVDEDKKIAKGTLENISDVAKKISVKIEAPNRDEGSVEFNVKKTSDLLINNITLRSLEYYDKSPFNFDKTKFTKDVNGIYTSQVCKFSDWDGQEVLLIVQPSEENVKVKYGYSNTDSLPKVFIPMPKKYIYSKWNNSGGVAPSDYLSLKDVFNIKFEARHEMSYLFLSLENNKTKTYYKIPIEREKENDSLCEFIKLSPKRLPLLDYCDVEGKQPNIMHNGIHEITHIFKLKNPRGSIKFYASTRDGRKEVEAKKITKGEYKGCYSVGINPLSNNSETYCEAYAVAENGRVAKSNTDPNGVYSLSLNNIFLTYSYEEGKDTYKYPSIPNYIKFERNKIANNKLFVRVIVPKFLKNDLDVLSIQPTPAITDLPSNMNSYSASFTAYKLTIDVSTLTKGAKLDITMPIKNTDSNEIVFTHLITVEEE